MSPAPTSIHSLIVNWLFQGSGAITLTGHRAAGLFQRETSSREAVHLLSFLKSKSTRPKATNKNSCSYLRRQNHTTMKKIKIVFTRVALMSAVLSLTLSSRVQAEPAQGEEREQSVPFQAPPWQSNGQYRPVPGHWRPPTFWLRNRAQCNP
jgi:hypothetical protein